MNIMNMRNIYNYIHVTYIDLFFSCRCHPSFIYKDTLSHSIKLYFCYNLAKVAHALRERARERELEREGGRERERGGELLDTWT